ncbi:MAG TPA: hypothetical protein VF701_22010 [Thermoanaerobaculia bacterium]
MTETRYCSNCREEISGKDPVCPSCGVYAGDVFDGRMPEDRKRRRRLVTLLLLLVVVAAGAWMLQWTPLIPYVERQVERWTGRGNTPAPELPPARVVGDRPGGARRGAGAALNEAEAIRLLRREIVAKREIGDDCVVVMSRGYEQGAYGMTAFDRCGNVRLGEWTVEGRTGQVRPRRVSP